MLDKLQNLDRRWIFLFVLIAVVVPLLKPIGFDIKTSKPVEDIYNYVDALPEGSVLLLSFDFGPSTQIELGPAVEAMTRHAFRKKLKVVAIALWPDGQQLARTILKKVADEHNAKYPNKVEYGKDYVNLGYKSGGPVLLMGLSSGFAQIFPSDVDGTPIGDLPIMNDVKDYSNVNMACSYSAGVPGMKEYVLIVATQYNVKVAAACTAVSAPEMYSFLDSGQLLGLMGGLKGAAEYEKLIEYKGEARKGMDAQSIVHFVIVLFIIFSNVLYFLTEFREKRLR